MVIHLYTIFTSELFLTLNPEDTDNAFNVARTTCIALIEKEVSNMSVPEGTNVNRISEMFDEVCTRVTTSFDEAMPGLGYPQVTGELNWITVDNFELSLLLNPKYPRPASMSMH